MESGMAYENDLNLKATELRLGLPGTDNETEEVASVRNRKRQLPGEDSGLKRHSSDDGEETAPPAK